MPRQVYLDRGRPRGPSRLSRTRQHNLAANRRRAKNTYNAGYSRVYNFNKRHVRRSLALMCGLAFVGLIVALVYLASNGWPWS